MQFVQIITLLAAMSFCNVYAQQTSKTAELTSSTAVADAESSAAMVPCADLPVGDLSDEDLARLVPAGTRGTVRIAWKTESQEDVFGFNVMRADDANGPYEAVNSAIIPGEGTTNQPMAYCFQDISVERGRVYFYQVQEVTNNGHTSVIEGTAKTRVQVKNVEEERAWLKKKAREAADKAGENK